MGEGARAACVIGWPVRHSRSPLIHGYWIKQYKLDAVYRREEIAPEAFADFLAHLAEHGYVGANITIPHKEAALAMSEPDDRARAVGAANTLWYDSGRLLSTNTDVEGFTANLDACGAGLGEARRRRGRARRRRLGARHHLWPDRARHRQDPRGQPHAGARAQALQARFGAGGAARPRGGAAASAHPDRAARQHDLARHDRPAAARHRSRAAAASCRGRRSGLCPAGNAVAGGGPRPWTWPPPMGSACCCTRRCGGSSSGSACARR